MLESQWELSLVQPRGSQMVHKWAQKKEVPLDKNWGSTSALQLENSSELQKGRMLEMLTEWQWDTLSGQLSGGPWELPWAHAKVVW